MSTKFEGEMIPVESSGISKVGYDKARRVMCIQFKGGSQNLYDDVSAHDHAQLIGAKSIGGHFQQHIRNRFSSTKL